jgi:nicotinamide mononucleotide transporter
MWMMARKFIEQWIVWIAVDIISVGLYIYKDIYFYATLYAIYSIVAILGYYNWKKLMQHDNNKSI